MRTAWLFAKRGNPDRERRADPRLTGLSRDTLIFRFLSPIAPLTGVAAPEGGWNSDCYTLPPERRLSSRGCESPEASHCCIRR
jgi:hypothetical protein